MALSKNAYKYINDFEKKLKMFQYSAHVIYYYPRELKKYLEFIGVEPEDADAEYLIKYRDYLYSKGLSNNTIRLKMNVIKTWYRFMYEDNPSDDKWRNRRIISKSITLSVRDRYGDHGYKPITLEQLRKLVRTAEQMSTSNDCEAECFIKLLVFTGGRAQFYGIKVSDIDFDNKTISLLVKGKKMHTVPMVSELEEVIRRHLRIRNYKSPFLFRNGKPSYVDGDAERTHKNMLSNLKNAERILQRVAVKAGLSQYTKSGKLVKGVNIHPHRIRKTLAHEGGELGLDLETVSDILGHSDISITKRVYRGHLNKQTREKLERVDILGKKKNNKVSVADLSHDEKKRLLRELLDELG